MQKFFTSKLSNFTYPGVRHASSIPEAKFQVVHFRPKIPAYSINSSIGWYSNICRSFQEAFAPKITLNFADEKELANAKIFAEVVMRFGEFYHTGNISQDIVKKFPPEFQSIFQSHINKSKTLHTHFSTPEFVFYPKSGPMNLRQFQTFINYIREVSVQLDSGVSWHLASFPLMVTREKLSMFKTQEDVFLQDTIIDEVFLLNSSKNGYVLINVGILGQGNKIMLYSKQYPSTADFIYPEQRELVTQAEDGHFGAFDFDHRIFKIKFNSQNENMILFFDMCNDHNHSVAIDAVAKLTDIPSRNINAMYEIVSSGLPGLVENNSPAILVDINDLQTGSDVFVISGKEKIISIDPIFDKFYNQTYFGDGLKMTSYCFSPNYGLTDRADRQFTPGIKS